MKTTHVLLGISYTLTLGATVLGLCSFPLLRAQPETSNENSRALRPLRESPPADSRSETRFTGLDFIREEGVPYGHEGETALTFDLFQPRNPNGAAILYVENMDMRSSRDMIDPEDFIIYLDRGYTVFAVNSHSAGEVAVTQIPQEFQRAVRFIRHNASRYGVNPERIGVTGFSSGGMLSLAIGVGGTIGNRDSLDPVDRESSAVEAVACFSPPTDLVNYGRKGADVVDALGDGILAILGPGATKKEVRETLERELSPIYHINSKMAPTLIIHGDADNVVPIQQSESFVASVGKIGAIARLVIAKGMDHVWERADELPLMADWFDQHLRGIIPSRDANSLSQKRQTAMGDRDPDANPTSNPRVKSADWPPSTAAIKGIPLEVIVGPSRTILDRKFGLSLIYPDSWRIQSINRSGMHRQNTFINFAIERFPDAALGFIYRANPDPKIAPPQDDPSDRANLRKVNAELPDRKTASEVDLWLKRFTQIAAVSRMQQSANQEYYAGFKNRPETFVFRTIGGRRALSWSTDFTRNRVDKNWREYHTTIYSSDLIIDFSIRAPAPVVEALRSSIDATIETVSLP